jgi:endonuclease/exonuclease/phosphatase family metal-dependent hydrolase
MHPFRLATWNVLADAYLDPLRYARTASYLRSPGARTGLLRDKVLEMIERLRLDVVCLQEVDPTMFSAMLKALRPDGWEPLWSPKTHDVEEGCLTLVSGEWSLAAWEPRPYVRTPGNLAQKMVLSRGTSEIVVYNTHFRWAPDHGATCLAQAAELATWTRSDHGVTLVVGDLNAPPKTPAITRLAEAGFCDAHSDPRLRTAVFDHSGPLRLDYILVRNAAAAPLAATNVTVNDTDPFPSPYMASDHIPLAARIEA